MYAELKRWWKDRILAHVFDNEATLLSGLLCNISTSGGFRNRYIYTRTHTKEKVNAVRA